MLFVIKLNRKDIMNKIIKEKLNKVLALLIIVIAFAITLIIMLKYKTEGEIN
jgi:hypothetical protein